MDRRQLLKGLPFAGAAAVLPAQLLAVEFTGPDLSELIDAHRVANARHLSAVQAEKDATDAVRTDQRKREPLSAMPGLGSVDIFIFTRAGVAAEYEGARRAKLSARGLDVDALQTRALANYDAAREAEEVRADEVFGLGAAVKHHKVTEQAATAALIALCAYRPGNEAEVAARCDYLLPLLVGEADARWNYDMHHAVTLALLGGVA